MKRFTLGIALALGAIPALANDAVTSWPYDGSFDDATFALENAIIGRGLVVDHLSHVGDMLARTGEDLGAEIEIFEAADVYLFCSAVISRQVMEVDPLNIAQCPYGIFVFAREGEVTMGFRTMPPGMEIVQELLTEVVQDALTQ